ncbi:hypothetical protein EJ06DRAFT_431512 [Trichodelitschia bisporula]|uniref:N-acetyltransferase domain-containing protein n=1 Tax=Trichodelitschia bisporula TaxID=703511 RepID=A0A6G1HWR4_9PEZI|nr:hypothetical protein EJ06DRAFT_431512 [Trichodelitschia bisporula]
MKLIQSRVREEDFDELLEIQFRAFSKVDLHQALFGPNTKEARDATKVKFIKTMHTDPTDCWMKLTDADTGKIVSAAQWKIYPSWTPVADDHAPEEDDPNADPDLKAQAAFLAKDFMERRAKHMYGHPHVLLYILFTDPAYHGSGAGTIQVKWGTDLADRLMVPTWVEGSPAGHHLYETCGFEDVELVCVRTKKWVSEYTIMRRPPKTSADFQTRTGFTRVVEEAANGNRVANGHASSNGHANGTAYGHVNGTANGTTH